jgi:hypothetical protein
MQFVEHDLGYRGPREIVEESFQQSRFNSKFLLFHPFIFPGLRAKSNSLIVPSAV